MRRLITAAVLVAALTSVSSASAITIGTADGSAHPNVGGLVAPVAYSDGTWIYCSGTLISPTVFLTAAHCAEASDQVRVTFSSAYQDGDKVYTGTFHGDPLYNQSQSDPHDIAVVVLDKAVKGIAPAQLPAANSLSNLRARSSSPRSATARTRSRRAPAATSTSTTTSAASRPARSTRSPRAG